MPLLGPEFTPAPSSPYPPPSRHILLRTCIELLQRIVAYPYRCPQVLSCIPILDMITVPSLVCAQNTRVCAPLEWAARAPAAYPAGPRQVRQAGPSWTGSRQQRPLPAEPRTGPRVAERSHDQRLVACGKRDRLEATKFSAILCFPNFSDKKSQENHLQYYEGKNKTISPNSLA